ncbi:MAG: ATP-dependent DNA helicase RecQ, partial [Myxococcota bacterium]
MTESAALGEAQRLLAEIFGYSEFRPGQADAIEAALTGRDVIVLLPTGSGKSLCFQIPAIVAGRRGQGTTVVVSPLIALMQDQVGALVGRGLRAAALHSHQTETEQSQAVAEFLAGELELLYVSPERAAKASFRRMLKRVEIALVAIDEAHCVSQWGHDFRPDYMLLSELREVVDAPMMALTATATPMVMKEIEKRLCLRRAVIVRTGFDRPNLAFSVRGIRTEKERIEVVLEELVRAKIRGRGGRGRAILYCSTRKVTERVAQALRSAGIRVGHYHAGRTKLARERAQQAFEMGRTRVLVATNAFGMGIDLPDIRLIIHFQTPGSVEAYYQEAGRAGRDGEPAQCLMFFGLADLATQRRLSERSATGGAQARRREDALAEIEAYALEARCRHQALVSHFSEEADDSECGRCDVCLGTLIEVEVQARRSRSDVAALVLSEDVKNTILAAVDRLLRPVGRRNLAQALRGGKAKTLSRGGLLTLPEYGVLSADSEDAVLATIDDLLVEGRLKRTGKKYPTVWMPDKPVRSTRKTGPSPSGTEYAEALKKKRSRYGGD